MDNLLPILLGLVFFGFKYYAKTQKEKNNITPIEDDSSTYVEENQATSLDDFINQFMGNEKEDIEVVPSINYEEENSTSDWMSKMHKEEPESIEFMPEKVENIEPDKQFEMIQNKNILEAETPDFDLKKAVIYDAILNPPYI